MSATGSPPSELSRSSTGLLDAARAAATLAVELCAVLLAVILFAFFLAAVGAAPGEVFVDMFRGAFGSSFSVQSSLSRAAPLLLTALCTALPARLGMVVIGNEGALLLGGLAAAATAMAWQRRISQHILIPPIAPTSFRRSSAGTSS